MWMLLTYMQLLDACDSLSGGVRRNLGLKCVVLTPAYKLRWYPKLRVLWPFHDLG